MLSAQHPSNISDSNWDVFNFDLCKGKGLEEGRYIWAFCASVCFALGFPASVAILVEMVQMHRRGTPMTPYDFFILNLSIMDAAFLLSIPPGLLNNFILKVWDIEAVWTGVYSLNQSGRPLLLSCVCLDCYFAVFHPIAYRQRKSLTPRFVTAVIVWVVTVATGMLLGISSKFYFTIIPYVPFIISLFIIVVCDSLILYKLIQSYPGRGNINPQKQRAVQILINSLVIIVISYLPPIVLFVVGNTMITSPTVFTCTIGIPVTISSSLGSAVMPILYLNNIGKLDRFKSACCRSS